MTTKTIKGREFQTLYPNGDKELARAWVAELRNPERKQVRARLRSDDGMCCLGVLCDVIDPTKWVRNASVIGDEQFSSWDWEGAAGTLPESVGARITGMEVPSRFDPDIPDLMALSVQVRAYGAPDNEYASGLNDVHNFTFSEIADVVEVVFDL